MEVDASHQAEIDSLLATFSNTGVDIQFQLNSDHSFQLMIHNTNGILPSNELVAMLENHWFLLEVMLIIWMVCQTKCKTHKFLLW